jgi:hypothetical protein
MESRKKFEIQTQVEQPVYNLTTYESAEMEQQKVDKLNNLTIGIKNFRENSH